MGGRGRDERCWWGWDGDGVAFAVLVQRGCGIWGLKSKSRLKSRIGWVGEVEMSAAGGVGMGMEMEMEMGLPSRFSCMGDVESGACGGRSGSVDTVGELALGTGIGIGIGVLRG